MPKPTLTEIVQRLERSVTTLEEQIKGIEICHQTTQRHSEDIVRLTVEAAVLREGVGSLDSATREKTAAIEKAVEQMTQRRWTLFVAVLSAFLGGALTLLIQFSLRGLSK